MPADGIHLTALREAMDAPSLDTPVRRLLVCRDDAGPDDPFGIDVATQIFYSHGARGPQAGSRWIG